MSLDFLRIDGVMIQKFGLDAAVLHALVEWRGSRRGGEWRASFTDILDDIGLSRSRVYTARKVLADAGYLTWSRGAQSSLTWSVLLQDPEGLLQDPALCPSYREDVEDNYPPAPLSETREEPSMTDPPALRGVPAEPEDGGLFDAAVVQPPEHAPTREEMANACRQAWLVAFTDRHGRPFPMTKSRAMGQIGAAVKACEEPEDFRAVWRAASEAGKAGEWAVTNWIGPRPQSRYERPGNVQLRLLTEKQGNPATAALNAFYDTAEYRELGQ